MANIYKKVGMISLGCPKNLVDSEIMLGLLEKAGYVIVTDPSNADILIVNTCGFIEDAKKESIDAILEMSGYKNLSFPQKRESPANKMDPRFRGDDIPRKKLIVTGCLPQRYKGEMANLFPEVDLFIGTGEYHRIVELIEGVAHFSAREQSQTKVCYSKNPTFIHTADVPRKISTARHAIYLKIAEGCFHGCSFCIIPKIRGKFRSRPIEDIAREAESLVKNGAKELNLIAQDTSSYGKDLNDGSSLTKLLKRLSAIPGDFWIRIMYAYPTSITDELIDEIAASKKVCKYLDIPIQHISDNILKLMRRKETGADIRNLISKLKEKIPDLTLRTSLIVGFPGETSSNFKELVEFVKEGHFNNLGVFAYSREEDTAAAKLPKQISQKVKVARQNEIMKLQQKISRRLNNKMLNRKVKVLVDGETVARTEGQAPEIDGVVKIADGSFARVGNFSNVRIVKTGIYDLIGEQC